MVSPAWMRAGALSSSKSTVCQLEKRGSASIPRASTMIGCSPSMPPSSRTRRGQQATPEIEHATADAVTAGRPSAPIAPIPSCGSRRPASHPARATPRTALLASGCWPRLRLQRRRIRARLVCVRQDLAEEDAGQSPPTAVALKAAPAKRCGSSVALEQPMGPSHSLHRGVARTRQVLREFGIVPGCTRRDHRDA
eukprot:CAMPEP_0181258226 /NCGR_PEP_ID=MMETSP1096-20121128/50666_1 /TAXON_ID=156174 ORGANISM="Chrysochromulina ericina, Strain CCMP281" /NCGR_SAMPLE_ID=MMETSP1096 /ASSEMBLY_ACC=CAM_ASM_000453 /LENGTH=194 /DNA_ID=CAMNT_0023356599 /DNA_START=226 /DNA_END=810 /DNA_ORIENTATION=-